MTNFDRQYRFQAGQNGSKGFEVGGTSDSNPIAMHIQFSVEKSDSESSNTAKVTIWNLSKAHRQALDQSNCKVVLKAGYGNNMALILDGTVTTCSSSIDSGDIATELEVVDGLVPIRDTYVTLNYVGKTESKTVFDGVVAQMGVSVKYSENCKFNTLPNGFSFVGAAKNALKQLCKTCKLSWSIQNGVLMVFPPNQPMKNKAYLLNQNTGLVGVPSKITIEEKVTSDSSASATKRTGYQIEYLMNGAIGVGDLIRLESKEVTGDFVVKSIQIDGDNISGDWLCTAKVLQQSASIGAVTRTSSVLSESGGSGSGNITVGCKVRVTRTFKSGSKTKGYLYGGGSFVLWYSEYDVISVSGDRVVIGIGKSITATVNASDLEVI